jgi:hypothetical protein
VAARSCDDVADLYTVLATDPGTPVQVQRRIADFGVRQSVTSLLLRLLERATLDSQVDDLLRQVRTPAVRAAWIARPDRTVDRVIAAAAGSGSEAVLAAAAAVRGLPGDCYSGYGHRDRLRVAAALLGNPDVPLPVKVTAAASYGRCYVLRRRVYTSEAQLAAVFAGQPSCMVAAAEQATHPVLIAYLAQHVVLPSRVVNRLLDDVLIPLVRGARPLAPPAPTTFRFGDPELTTVVEVAAAALMSQRHAYPVRCGDLRAALRENTPFRDVNHSHNLGRLPAIAAAVAALSGLDEVAADRVSAAATPARAQQVLLERGDQQWTEVLAAAAVRNPAVTGPGLAGTLRAAAAVLEHRYLLPLLRDCVRLRARDPGSAAIVLTAALAAQPRAVGDFDDMVGLVADPEATMLALVREYAGAAKAVPWDLSRSRFMTATVFAALPLRAATGNGTQVPGADVAQLLLAQLRTDEQWVTFETLGRQLTGPLSVVLEASSLIHDRSAEGSPGRPSGNAPVRPPLS